jgi:hypothetical protein
LLLGHETAIHQDIKNDHLIEKESAMNISAALRLGRRDALKVGVLGATGITLDGYLRQAASGAVRSGATAKAGILIYMSGGPSHMDTFDLKPDAPSEYRGEFKEIKTNAADVRISEHLPKLARCADKYAILRGVSHGLAAHEFGRAYMTTGNAPLASLTFPGYGSVVSKERPTAPDLPPYVAVPRTPETAGYLGVQYTALSTNSSPVKGQPFAVRGMALQKGTSTADVVRRRELLDDLDQTFASIGEKDDLLKGLDRFSVANRRRFPINSATRRSDKAAYSRCVLSKQAYGSSRSTSEAGTRTAIILRT